MGHEDLKYGTWGCEVFGPVDVTYGTRGRELWDMKYGTRGREEWDTGTRLNFAVLSMLWAKIHSFFLFSKCVNFPAFSPSLPNS